MRQRPALRDVVECSLGTRKIRCQPMSSLIKLMATGCLWKAMC